MRGHIQKRRPTSWRIVVDLPRGEDGKRKQKFLTIRGDQKDAEKALNRLLYEVEAGVYIDPSKGTLAVRRTLQQTQDGLTFRESKTA